MIFMDNSDEKVFFVLHVDDSYSFLTEIKPILEKFGCIVSHAYDGKHGLSNFTRSLGGNDEHIDLIIADYNMPNMDGVEMTEEIRKIPNSTPVVMLTSEPLKIKNEKLFSAVLNKSLLRDDAEKFEENLKNLLSKRQRILYAEDKMDIAEKMIKYFDKRGFSVAHAGNGGEAFYKFKDAKEFGFPFNLVFTDYMMPGMDGEQLANEIRKIDDDIPIIAYSFTPDSIKNEEIFFRILDKKSLNANIIETSLKNALEAAKQTKEAKKFTPPKITVNNTTSSFIRVSNKINH
ncbi:MAG: response regulator [Candidatus Micrarchaeota archaeon]